MPDRIRNCWAFVLAIPVITGLVLSGCGRDRMSSVPAATSSAAGVLFVPDWAAARTSADGEELSIWFIGRPAHDSDDPCTVVYTASASEISGNVLVEILGQPPTSSERSGSDPAATCESLGYQRNVTVKLREPLGQRAVLNAASGRPQRIFDGSRLATVGWVPPDFALVSEGAAYPMADTTKVWSRSWVASTASSSPSCSITFVEGDQSAVAALPTAMGGATFVGTHVVGDAQARFSASAERAAHQLTWQDARAAYAVIGVSCGADEAALEVLLHVARGIE